MVLMAQSGRCRYAHPVFALSGYMTNDMARRRDFDRRAIGVSCWG